MLRGVDDVSIGEEDEVGDLRFGLREALGDGPELACPTGRERSAGDDVKAMIAVGEGLGEVAGAVGAPSSTRTTLRVPGKLWARSEWRVC